MNDDIAKRRSGRLRALMTGDAVVLYVIMLVGVVVGVLVAAVPAVGVPAGVGVAVAGLPAVQGPAGPAGMRVRSMAKGPRMTMQTQMVLRQALLEPTREWYGLEMVQATGLPSGTVYPIITRLEQCRWIVSRWEDPKE